MPIHRLPLLLVNQIAAGEVIERPASVVKELVENALDAGAGRIDVAIEMGGREFIRVADDGCGIAAEELELAVAPHATSKIASAEDLNAIATLGFRGEALASIASVSRLSLLSRTAQEPAAAVLEIEGNERGAVTPAAGPVGTAVTVRNLFFNTPARRKFLRAEQTEAGRVADCLENLALAHHAVAFSLTSDGRQRLQLPAGQSPRQRALAVLGLELEPELLELRETEHGLLLWGLVGKPAIARGSAKHQRLFVNGRTVVDRSIGHAIKEAYRGLIEPTRSPTALLFVTIDPAQVDVNVHPTKAEVRFRNQGQIHGAVLSAIRRVLRAADLVAQVALAPPSLSWSEALAAGQIPAPAAAAGHDSFGSGLGLGRGAGEAWRHPRDSAREFVEHFRRLDPHQKGFVYGEMKQALAGVPLDVNEPLASRPAGLAAAAVGDGENEVLPIVRPVADVLQVHSSYIVTQDEQGLLIIDQHALHERVMFERIKSRIERGPLESQRLLLPVTFEADRAQLEALCELGSLLSRLGIDASPIGPASVAVHSFTSLLLARGVEPAPFLRELLEHTAARGANHEPEAALHEVLDMMACKAAVKAGDRLSHEELAELLKHRETVERASNCPHGRPTSLRLSLKELARQFGRS